MHPFGKKGYGGHKLEILKITIAMQRMHAHAIAFSLHHKYLLLNHVQSFIFHALSSYLDNGRNQFFTSRRSKS